MRIVKQDYFSQMQILKVVCDVVGTSCEFDDDTRSLKIYEKYGILTGLLLAKLIANDKRFIEDFTDIVPDGAFDPNNVKL